MAPAFAAVMPQTEYENSPAKKVYDMYIKNAASDSQQDITDVVGACVDYDNNVKRDIPAELIIGPAVEVDSETTCVIINKANLQKLNDLDYIDDVEFYPPPVTAQETTQMQEQRSSSVEEHDEDPDRKAYEMYLEGATTTGDKSVDFDLVATCIDYVNDVKHDIPAELIIGSSVEVDSETCVIINKANLQKLNDLDYVEGFTRGYPPPLPHHTSGAIHAKYMENAVNATDSELKALGRTIDMCVTFFIHALSIPEYLKPAFVGFDSESCKNILASIQTERQEAKSYREQQEQQKKYMNRPYVDPVVTEEVSKLFPPRKANLDVQQLYQHYIQATPEDRKKAGDAATAGPCDIFNETCHLSDYIKDDMMFLCVKFNDETHPPLPIEELGIEPLFEDQYEECVYVPVINVPKLLELDYVGNAYSVRGSPASTFGDMSAQKTQPLVQQKLIPDINEQSDNDDYSNYLYFILIPVAAAAIAVVWRIKKSGKIVTA